jgi:hypothetical protein
MVDGDVIPILAVSLVFGIPLVAIVGHYGYRAWKVWLELNLKREMVARGYTAEEILTVLQATNSSRVEWSAQQAAHQPRDPAML